jgi:hypothetical protein
MLPGKKILLAISLFVSFFAVSGCQYIYQSGFVPIPNQPISGPIEIGPEWIEILPPKPLVSFTSTAIYFRGIDGDFMKTPVHDLTPAIVLKDGRRIKMEAILYDDEGESYELMVSQFGNGIGFIRQKTVELENGKLVPKYYAFPHDRSFTKLRVRSDIPIKCDSIELTQSVPY